MKKNLEKNIWSELNWCRYNFCCFTPGVLYFSPGATGAKINLPPSLLFPHRDCRSLHHVRPPYGFGCIAPILLCFIVEVSSFFHHLLYPAEEEVAMGSGTENRSSELPVITRKKIKKLIVHPRKTLIRATYIFPVKSVKKEQLFLRKIVTRPSIISFDSILCSRWTSQN